MKKIFYNFVFIFLLFISTTYAAPSESFKKVLSMINIPITNVNGYEINEEIYNKYGLIVYGNPKDVSKNQRWKETANGKWINEVTKKKGEYRILGYSLTGTVVNNELFPDDYTSGKSPVEWEYIVIEDALSSWNDTEKYQTKEQQEYMLTQKLTRNGVTYDLTAQDIGLDKARLEAYATWKTAGSIFTLKYDEKGILWGATFNIPPMAADAKVDAKLNFYNGTTYTIDESQDSIEIPFSYGAEVIGLTEFAKKEDIKNLSSEIEVQYETFDKINGEKITTISKENKIVINKEDYQDINEIEVVVRNTAILETYFFTEAPMVDIEEITLNIILNEDSVFISVEDVNKIRIEEVPRPIISSIKLYRESVNGLENMKELYVARKTGIQFICAGQVLIVEANILNAPTSVKFYIQGDSRIQTLDELTKRFVYDEPKKRNERLIYSSITKLENSYKLPRTMQKESGVYKIKYIIPYGTKQTIHSWNTLRNINKNAFEIDDEQLFSRITQPYKIKIRAQNAGGTVTKSIELDVFERWDTVYNRDISEYVK